MAVEILVVSAAGGRSGALAAELLLGGVFVNRIRLSTISGRKHLLLLHLIDFLEAITHSILTLVNLHRH